MRQAALVRASRLLLSILELERSLTSPHAELWADAHVHLLHIRIALALQAIVPISGIFVGHLCLVHVRVVLSVAWTHQDVAGLVPGVFHLPVGSCELLLWMRCLRLRVLATGLLQILIGVSEVYYGSLMQWKLSGR